MSGIRCRQAKGSQRIRDDIRGRGEVFTRCGREVHDAFDAVQHIPGFPAGHSHVFHGGCRLRCRELGFCTHLAGFGTELVEVISRCTGNGSNLAHFCIKVRCRLDCCCTKASNSRRYRQKLFARVLDLGAHRLQLVAHCINFGKGRIGDRCLFLQGFELFLCFHDLALECIVLLLRDLAICQLFIGLLCRRLEGRQLLLGGFDGFLQHPLLLGNGFRVGGVEL